MRAPDTGAPARRETPAWMAALPGYRGYKEKELRREDDQILRHRISTLLRRHADALRIILGTHFRYGPEDLLMLTDHLADRARALADAVLTAAHGYDGLFDRQSTREPELDRVRQLDQDIMHQVLALSARAPELDAAARMPRRYAVLCRAHQRNLRALTECVEKRADLLG